jgi:hypothetical protein
MRRLPQALRHALGRRVVEPAHHGAHLPSGNNADSIISSIGKEQRAVFVESKAGWELQQGCPHVTVGIASPHVTTSYRQHTSRARGEGAANGVSNMGSTHIGTFLL